MDCTPGARFHTKFANTLRALGFTPTYTDPNVWICDTGDCCKYVVAHVDDTLTTLKDPDTFYKESQSDPWNHKLMNVEEPKYHLSGDFFHDKDGTLCCGAQTHVRHLVDAHKELFGKQPKEVHSPMTLPCFVLMVLKVSRH